MGYEISPLILLQPHSPKDQANEKKDFNFDSKLSFPWGESQRNFKGILDLKQEWQTSLVCFKVL